MTTMKITKLAISNYLGIKSFVLSDLGQLNFIRGRNGAGKTGVLKAITDAIKSAGVDGSLIRIGEDEASILIELNNSIRIERTLTEGGNSVDVTVGGAPVARPQSFLNSLISPYIFNPVAFFLAAKAERVRLLLQALPISVDAESIDALLFPDKAARQPIDYSKFDFSKHGLVVVGEIAEYVYDWRTGVNRDVDRLKKTIEQDRRDLPEVVDAKRFDGFVLTEAVAEVAAAAKSAETLNQLSAALTAAEDKVKALETRAVEINAEIIELERSLAQKREAYSKITSEDIGFAKMSEKEALSQLRAFQSAPVPDVAATQKLIDDYESFQAVKVKFDDIERRRASMAKSEAVAGDLDAIHKRLKKDIPAELLRRLGKVVGDIEIVNDDLLVNGKNIDNLSTSEQLRIAVEIARLLDAKLKVICIDRYESLDPEAKANLQTIIEGDGFEYFITEVTSGDLHVEKVGSVVDQESLPIQFDNQAAEAPKKGKRK